MPLSKVKQAEYMREYRKKSVIPNFHSVILSPFSVIPNPYLEGHLEVCPDYDPVIPNHFNHCLFIKPLLSFQEGCDLLPNCPDGRHRPI